jgi:hypothetical protein
VTLFSIRNFRFTYKNHKIKRAQEERGIVKIKQGGKAVWRQGTKQQTPWPLVRERTIPTERPSLVDEI